MGFISKTRELLKVFLENDEIIDSEKMTEEERENILKKYEEGYKEFCKSDSKIKTTEKSVKDYAILVGKMERLKPESLNIDKVLTKNQRAAMSKYYKPQEEQER